MFYHSILYYSIGRQERSPLSAALPAEGERLRRGHTRIHIHTHIHTHTYTHTYVYMFAYTYDIHDIHMHIHIHIHLFIHNYVHTHIYTCLHTPIHRRIRNIHHIKQSDREETASSTASPPPESEEPFDGIGTPPTPTPQTFSKSVSLIEIIVNTRFV